MFIYYIKSVSGVKDTAKTNKDLGMSCYIQVEGSARPEVRGTAEPHGGAYPP